MLFGFLVTVFAYLYLLRVVQLPLFCYVNRLFHLYCPGCGFSRATEALLCGDLLASLTAHPFALSFVVLVAYYEIALARRACGRGRVSGAPGTVFAVVGAQLAVVLNKNNKTSYVFAALFGVLLSVFIAVVWEIFEYSSDVFLHSDMQADTVIDSIVTKINRTDGIADAYEGITETVVNGQSLGIQGYLDIGLIDTMHDMIIETVGALIFSVYVLIDRNRHPMIQDLKDPARKGSKTTL